MNITWPGIIAIAILILSCLHGYRRGLIREVVSLKLCSKAAANLQKKRE